MPKKPAVDPAVLMGHLQDVREQIVNTKGVIAVPSALIWEQLATTASQAMTPKYIYSFVKGNRHNCHSNLGIHNTRDTFSEEIQESESEDEEEEDDHGDVDWINSARSCHAFGIVISPEDWASMKLEEVKYRSRSYTILGRGRWTHIVNEHVWRARKIPCIWSLSIARCIQQVMLNNL